MNTFAHHQPLNLRVGDVLYAKVQSPSVKSYFYNFVRVTKITSSRFYVEPLDSIHTTKIKPGLNPVTPSTYGKSVKTTYIKKCGCSFWHDKFGDIAIQYRLYTPDLRLKDFADKREGAMSAFFGNSGLVDLEEWCSAKPDEFVHIRKENNNMVDGLKFVLANAPTQEDIRHPPKNTVKVVWRHLVHKLWDVVHGDLYHVTLTRYPASGWCLKRTDGISRYAGADVYDDEKGDFDDETLKQLAKELRKRGFIITQPREPIPGESPKIYISIKQTRDKLLSF